MLSGNKYTSLGSVIYQCLQQILGRKVTTMCFSKEVCNKNMFDKT